ncbi:hypothetical protein [Solicola gregarius]|uniref:Uncharacterized protein n=1 Tax=Solicola gregarius TaxID=2908642 RepID=A0AA46TL58_9ACTN|nr:hypothetical protein [Solicola gregarius]UYM06932.1 hypothetical protein L0C25_07610 [Solicola gregarius]
MALSTAPEREPTTRPEPTTRGRHWVVRRWPTWVALASAAVTFDGPGGAPVDDLAQFVIILQLIYVVAATIGWRWLGWAGLFASVPLTMAVEAQTLVSPATLLVGVALVVLAWGVARPQLRRSGTYATQAAGMVMFAALALVALAAAPDLALYLTAAGWFAHGAWDFVHLWKDRVVLRSFAEWCGVVDVLLAAELVLLA